MFKSSPKDRLFVMQSIAAKEESYDPDRQVGVVIISPLGKLLATGSNKPPSELKLTSKDSLEAIAQDPNWKYFIFEHAERNAINSARAQGHSLVGAAMYSTLFPCADCARAIVSSGISRLVAPPPNRHSHRDEKWREHYRYAHQIFRLAGTRIDLLCGAELERDSASTREILYPLK